MSARRVVVVGGGPAGIAAAAAAAQAGAAAILYDEQTEPGGQLLYQVQAVETGAGAPAEYPQLLRKRLIAEAVAAGAELRSGAVVAAAFPDKRVLVITGEHGADVRWDALVVATGSTDLPYPFAGATLPGVWSGRALQILLNRWRVRPGKRFAIVGTDARADELAVDVLLAGGEVVWSGIAPAPFLRAEGEANVRAFTIGQEQVEVDGIAIAVGRQADAALAAMCGAELGFSAALGGLVPVVNERLQTRVANLFVAGDAAGAGSIAAAIAEGRLAGLTAAAALGLGSERDVEFALSASGEELAWRRTERAGIAARFVQPYE